MYHYFAKSLLSMFFVCLSVFVCVSQIPKVLLPLFQGAEWSSAFSSGFPMGGPSSSIIVTSSHPSLWSASKLYFQTSLFGDLICPFPGKGPFSTSSIHTHTCGMQLLFIHIGANFNLSVLHYFPIWVKFYLDFSNCNSHQYSSGSISWPSKVLWAKCLTQLW